MTAMAATSAHIGISRYTVCCTDCSAMWSPSPEISAHSGRMIVISMIFAPRMLPTDIDDCFLTMAVMAVTSSGSEVPMATIVTAMMRSDTPSSWARTVPLSTSRFEPTTRHAAPTANSTRFFRSALRLLSTTAAPSVCSSAESFFALRMFSMMNATNSASTIRLSGRLSTPSRHKSQSTSVLTTIKTPFTAN